MPQFWSFSMLVSLSQRLELCVHAREEGSSICFKTTESP